MTLLARYDINGTRWYATSAALHVHDNGMIYYATWGHDNGGVGECCGRVAAGRHQSTLPNTMHH